MIVAAVVCPHPPLLLRELSGAQDALPDLRQACRDALTEALAAEPGAVVVVGGADAAGEWDPALPVDVRRFGTSGAPRVEGLPLSLGVAKRLLEDAGWGGPLRLLAVPWGADDTAVAAVAREVVGVEGGVLLLVLGDGSNRRGEKAPGYLDDRSFGYDAEVGRALAEGDASALARLDAELGADLAVAGRAAFAVLGQAAAMQADTMQGVSSQGEAPRARVLWSGDPFGVQYTVATWWWDANETSGSVPG